MLGLESASSAVPGRLLDSGLEKSGVRGLVLEAWIPSRARRLDASSGKIVEKVFQKKDRKSFWKNSRKSFPEK
jgi:hypothetical protein